MPIIDNKDSFQSIDCFKQSQQKQKSFENSQQQKQNYLHEDQLQNIQFQDQNQQNVNQILQVDEDRQNQLKFMHGYSTLPKHDSGSPPICSIDSSAAQTWTYLESKEFREYQFKMVECSLFYNTFVCLPTGLGKTFIAANTILNYYNWFPMGKIFFLAPTRPLVSQQIKAMSCIDNIPPEHMQELTGTTPFYKRQQCYDVSSKIRIFFMTPETLQNDLENGRLDRKGIVLVVFDEAHRAAGYYAYSRICYFLFNGTSKPNVNQELQTENNIIVNNIGINDVGVRILALSATPGNSLEKIQEMVQILQISRLFVQDETDQDVAKYLFNKNIVPIVISQGIQKLDRLFQLLSQYFVSQDALLDNSKAMVFTNNRASAQEIALFLNRNANIKASLFVGQAKTKLGGVGQNQKQQLGVIEKLKKHEINTLVATCIGEEGLDIGEIDLIVCYDSAFSPIRMIQRIGRTGRKRAGQVYIMLMEGKEEKKYKKAQTKNKQLKKMVRDNGAYSFRQDEKLSSILEEHSNHPFSKSITKQQQIEFFQFNPRMLPEEFTPKLSLINPNNAANKIQQIEMQSSNKFTNDELSDDDNEQSDDDAWARHFNNYGRQYKLSSKQELKKTRPNKNKRIKLVSPSYSNSNLESAIIYKQKYPSKVLPGQFPESESESDFDLSNGILRNYSQENLSQSYQQISSQKSKASISKSIKKLEAEFQNSYI